MDVFVQGTVMVRRMSSISYYCLGIALRAQLPKKNAWLLHLIGDKAPLATRDCSGLLCCYPHTGHGGLNCCLSSSLSLSVGFSIQDKARDVARSAPQGAHYYHADVIYLLP